VELAVVGHGLQYTLTRCDWAAGEHACAHRTGVSVVWSARTGWGGAGECGELRRALQAHLRRARHQRTAHRLSGRADGRRQGERRFLPAALAVTPSPSRTAAPTGAPLRSAWVTPRRPHAPTGDDARGFEAAHRGSGEVGGWLFGIAAMATPRATAADGTARRQPKVVTAPPAPEPHRFAHRRAARAAQRRVVPSHGRVTRAL
jgi:hypothetical protein